MKSWLEKHYIEMYSTHNEGQSVRAKRLIRTLKNKIYKYMTSILKNMYIRILDDIVNKYNNKYHKTMKMKPVVVKKTHILTLVKKLMIKILNSKVVSLLEYQNTKAFFQRAMVQIGLNKVLWFIKLNILFRDLKG